MKNLLLAIINGLGAIYIASGIIIFLTPTHESIIRDGLSPLWAWLASPLILVVCAAAGGLLALVCLPLGAAAKWITDELASNKGRRGR